MSNILCILWTLLGKYEHKITSGQSGILRQSSSREIKILWQKGGVRRHFHLATSKDIILLTKNITFVEPSLIDISESMEDSQKYMETKK